MSRIFGGPCWPRTSNSHTLASSSVNSRGSKEARGCPERSVLVAHLGAVFGDVDFWNIWNFGGQFGWVRKARWMLEGAFRFRVHHSCISADFGWRMDAATRANISGLVQNSRRSNRSVGRPESSGAHPGPIFYFLSVGLCGESRGAIIQYFCSF